MNLEADALSRLSEGYSCPPALQSVEKRFGGHSWRVSGVNFLAVEWILQLSKLLVDGLPEAQLEEVFCRVAGLGSEVGSPRSGMEDIRAQVARPSIYTRHKFVLNLDSSVAYGAVRCGEGWPIHAWSAECSRRFGVSGRVLLLRRVFAELPNGASSPVRLLSNEACW
eukprot:6220646-Amphidinium_carterae.1